MSTEVIKKLTSFKNPTKSSKALYKRKYFGYHNSPAELTVSTAFHAESCTALPSRNQPPIYPHDNNETIMSRRPQQLTRRQATTRPNTDSWPTATSSYQLPQSQPGLGPQSSGVSGGLGPTNDSRH